MKSTSRYTEGEMIPLFDEGGRVYDDEVYVKGHVANDVADDAYQEWWANYGDEPDDPAPELGPWKHGYARWSMENWEGAGLVLRSYSEPGRGRFKVTWAEQKSIIDERAARKQREADARAMFADRFPGATLHAIEAWKAGSPVRAWFDVPGTEHGAIHWREDDPEHVSVCMIDLEHWEAYKATKAYKQAKARYNEIKSEAS